METNFDADLYDRTGGSAAGAGALPEVDIHSGYYGDEPHRRHDVAAAADADISTEAIGSEIDAEPAGHEPAFVADGVGDLVVSPFVELTDGDDPACTTDRAADNQDPHDTEGDTSDAPAPADGGTIVPPTEPPDGTAEMGEPEPLPHGVQTVIDETDQLLTDGNIGTPERNMEYLRGMSDGDMEDFIVRTAGRSTGLTTFIAPRGPRGVVRATLPTGEEGITYLPPAPEDRRPLLHDTLEAAKAQPTPDRAFGLVGLQMGTIHPVRDGNVRTGHRLFNMRNEYSGSPADHKFLADTLTVNSDAPHANLNTTRLGLNRQFVTPITAARQAELGIPGPAIDRVHLEEGGVMMRGSIGTNEQQILVMQAMEPHFNVPTILSTIQAMGRPVDRYIQVGETGERVLNATRFLEDLSPRDAELMSSIADTIKRDFVSSINALFMGDPAAEAMYGSVDDLLTRMKNGLA
jgi:hypothetical protein